MTVRKIAYLETESREVNKRRLVSTATLKMVNINAPTLYHPKHTTSSPEKKRKLVEIKRTIFTK